MDLGMLGMALQNFLTPFQGMQMINEARREAEKIIVSDRLSEMRHRQEIWKMTNDTLRAIRSMHWDSTKKQMQYQEKIAKTFANMLGKTW